MEFGTEAWRSYDRGIEKEWLLTNGIGGFSSSTLIGANTRRYHGLLVASLKPPVERHLILSKIDEALTVGNKTFPLYSHRTPGHTMKGFLHLQRVIVDHLPTFIYSLGNIYIEKTVCMLFEENTVCIHYHITNSGSDAALRLTPLVNFRDYHHLASSGHMVFNTEPREYGAVIRPYDTGYEISLLCSGGNFTVQEGCRFYGMEYAAELERGLDAVEDHYIPGYFEVEVKGGRSTDITVMATIEKNARLKDGREVIAAERERVRCVRKASGLCDEFALKLVEAADAFIVKRNSTGTKTILAGYPWFTDWGRDTMISLPGLTLATGRMGDAREILNAFSAFIKEGLLPNMFPDAENQPSYNTVDAPLWYFEAAYKYAEYSGDFRFVSDNLIEGLKNIVDAFIKGTHFNIKMDSDYLISAGDADTQLTWMDAKAGGRPVTPRHGKPVEINALWYNALRIMARFSEYMGDGGNALFYSASADKARKSFEREFWNSGLECLYDVVDGEYRDDSIRPNQVFAASLSFPVIEGDKAQKVILKVWKELYTPYGLRSLAPSAEGYKGVYQGDPYSRDGAYHQGTVWAWPLGHFISGFIKAFGATDENRRIALRFIIPFTDHMRDGCLGNISEIFDGDSPHIPRGCFAQAWSTAEILRAYVEDVEAIAPVLHI